uniref:Amino acid permease/ SLC12A domain-containing protein n=1 Tax=Anopheles coluzzii TaxID=1518534 RepID=A0A8W7PB03_ANOCL
LAGFLVRYSYWTCIVMAVGTEVTAVAEYMQYWFPNAPSWIWIVLFSGVLIGVNAMSVKAFGTVEYWFSAIKIFAIVGFILLGSYVVWGSGNPAYGMQNFTSHGAILSVEMIAVAAGEAEHPEQAVRPRPFRATIVRLLVFYVLSLTLILAIVPWDGLDKGSSPFVTVMQVLGIPYAAGILNFVVIVAALSAMNSQLYITTRMMFSLSRAGDAPASLGKLNHNGIPLNALLLSTSGIALATLLFVLFPGQAFTLKMSLSMFGALFTWMMIFLTHWYFRRHHQRHGTKPLAFRLPGFPLSTLLGLGLMLAILLTTALTDVFRLTLAFGLPFLLLLVVLYRFVRPPRP